MTQSEKDYARWCVENNPHVFYKWSKWLQVRQQVLSLDRNECQLCRNKYHRYRRADTVHHVNHLKDRPDLALEIYYENPATHKRERNLIALCHDCHEEVHGYRIKNFSEPITPERWD